MSETHDVDLAEFDRLRSEIDSRTTLSNQLISYQLTALGAGIAVFDKYPDVLLGLAAVSTFLWLFWIDHTTQIYKIAAYLELGLAPRLRKDGADVLSWERFLRRIDAGGETAERELYGEVTGRNLQIQATKWIAGYTAGLLGFSTLVLLTIWAAPKLQKLRAVGYRAVLEDLTLPQILRFATALAVIIAWLFAWHQFRAFARTRDAVGNAILSVGTSPHRSPDKHLDKD
jgi:hypothetical protein